MELCHINPHLRFASALLGVTMGSHVKVTDCRIFCVTQGVVVLRIDGQCYTLTPGSLFYCAGGSEYTITAEYSYRLLCLNFDLTQAHNGNARALPVCADPAQWSTMPVHSHDVTDSPFLNSHLYLPSAPHAQESVRRIVAEFSSGSRLCRELSSALLKALLMQLHRMTQHSLPPKISLIKDYLDSHFAQDISNRALAELAGYHEYHLNRLFTSCMGLSLHAYLLQVRLRRAAYLILNTELELISVAEQVGFHSYPHFSGSFKQAYGYSPAQYRKQLKGQI